jgi:hypothetical protein
VKRGIAVVALIAVGITSIVAPPVSAIAAPPSPEARKADRQARKAYLKVLEEYTDHLVLYRGFATSLNVRGTYLDEPFRDAFADQRTQLLQADAEDHRRFKAIMDSDGEAYHEVVFSADSGIKGAEQFGENEDGWILRLEADGHEEELVTAFAVRKPNPLQLELYTHKNTWSTLWIARFAKTVKDPDRVVMHFSSGYGHGDLVWNDLHSGKITH